MEVCVCLPVFANNSISFGCLGFTDKDAIFRDVSGRTNIARSCQVDCSRLRYCHTVGLSIMGFKCNYLIIARGGNQHFYTNLSVTCSYPENGQTEKNLQTREIRLH